MHDNGDLAVYELPVLSSRRGIIQALLGLSAAFVLLFVATEIERFSDAVVISLFAALFVAATPFLKLSNPLIRLVIGASLYAPIFIAAALASSTTVTLMLVAVGVEVLVFCYLLLQAGKAEVNVRGVVSKRLVTSNLSFDEISGVKRFDSRLGKLLRHAGFGSTSVELLLFSWRRVRLNVAPDAVDEFIERVSSNIDPAVQYDLFFLPPAETRSAAAATPGEPKPIRRRGKRAKRLRDQQRAAPQTPSASR